MEASVRFPAASAAPLVQKLSAYCTDHLLGTQNTKIHALAASNICLSIHHPQPSTHPFIYPPSHSYLQSSVSLSSFLSPPTLRPCTHPSIRLPTQPGTACPSIHGKQSQERKLPPNLKLSAQDPASWKERTDFWKLFTDLHMHASARSYAHACARTHMQINVI